MDAEQKFVEFLSKKRLRHTDQRTQIAKIFLKTEKHVTTQELYNIVKKRHKNIGYATVSRTLKLLDKARLCNVVDLGDGFKRFEHKYGHVHHDHLVCSVCGSFVEIYSKQIELLQDKLIKKHGYIQQSHRLEIFGICPKCQPKSKKKK